MNCMQDLSGPFQSSLISMRELVPSKASEKEWKSDGLKP